MATILQFPVKPKTRAAQNRERILELLGPGSGGKLLDSIERERAKRGRPEIGIAEPGTDEALAFDRLASALLEKALKKDPKSALLHALAKMEKERAQKS